MSLLGSIVNTLATKKLYPTDHLINLNTWVWPISYYSLSQLNYADMLKRVDPLRNELSALENRAETTRIKGEEIKTIVFELEESIAKYKEEYAMLISEANAIKADLSTVEAKVSGREGRCSLQINSGNCLDVIPHQPWKVICPVCKRALGVGL